MKRGTAILMVGNFLSHAKGIRFVCEDLSDHLEARGHQVVRTSRHVNRIRRLLDMVSIALRQRAHYAMAVVEVYSGLSFLWAEIVCAVLRWLGKPYVLVLHGGGLPVYAQRWPGRVRRLIRSAAFVTTPSHYVQSSFQDIRPDLTVIPNGIDLRNYPFRARSQPAPRLVWLRGFHTEYRPAVALEAFALVKDEFPDARLSMIGPDKGDGSLQHAQQVATRLGINDRVTFSDAIPKAQVPAALNAHDIFLNTTMLESFGVGVVEAGACGLCIITTNVGELPYIWEHERSALLVPPDDPAALAAAIRRIVTDPTLAAQLSRNARTNAERFDWATVVTQWEAVFETVGTQQVHQTH